MTAARRHRVRAVPRTMTISGTKPYDCIMVFGASIVRLPSGDYAPSTYEQSDQFGMLGGHMRNIAAALLCLDRQTNTVVFSSGKSRKVTTELGHRIPGVAGVYRDHFLRLLGELAAAGQAFETPHTILEPKSANTAANIGRCFALARRYGWERFAFVTSDYHVPRVQALTSMIHEIDPLAAECAFIGAETIARSLRPGTYDQAIDTAYATAAAIKRVQSEIQGLADIRSGRYVMTEFQLQTDSH